jgi:hypothetical protein
MRTGLLGSLPELCVMLLAMPARKDPHAVALGRKGGKASMEGRTADEREQFARQGGIAGGAARAKALTKAERAAIARKAAAARWRSAANRGKKSPV